MLFAYCPSDASDRKGILRKFLNLAAVGRVPKHTPPGHLDGWGMALFKDHERSAWYRSMASAIDDPNTPAQLENVSTIAPDALLAHIRKATKGEPSELNSHPFVYGSFAFIHNGTLGAADQQVFSLVGEKVLGGTDSERYFHLIIKELEEKDAHDPEDVHEAIERTVHAIRVGTSYEGGRYSSASSMLTDGAYAYILREFDETHPLVAKHDTMDYYTLFLGRDREGNVVACSEALDLPDMRWELLPNHSLTIINCSDGTSITHMLTLSPELALA